MISKLIMHMRRLRYLILRHIYGHMYIKADGRTKKVICKDRLAPEKKLLKVESEMMIFIFCANFLVSTYCLNYLPLYFFLMLSHVKPCQAMLSFNHLFYVKPCLMRRWLSWKKCFPSTQT